MQPRVLSSNHGTAVTMDDDILKSSANADMTASPMEETSTGDSTITLPPQTPTSKPVRESSTSSVKRLQTKRTTSAANSPVPSRESSPIRPQPKANASNRPTTGPGRSRKNSTQEISPSRPANTSANPPSAAATQRALSAATTPNLPPSAADSAVKAPVPQKALATSEIRETPRWPVSPRLRSPPPINRPSILSPRKFEYEAPANVRGASPSEPQDGRALADAEVDDSVSLSNGMRTPARGASGASSTLETVQEISQPNTPGPGLDGRLDGILEKAENGSPNINEKDDSMGNPVSKDVKPKANNESGSDSGGKGEIKMRSTAPPTSLRPNAPAKAYSTNTTRGKPSGEGSTRNMTVETETVSSIPQVAVGGPGVGNNGSIRAKPSTETIRPKKEKKKTARKTPSVTGTGEQPHFIPRPRLSRHYSSGEQISVDRSSFPEQDSRQGLYCSFQSRTKSPERPTLPVSRRPSSVFSDRTIRNVSSKLMRVPIASSKADIFEAKVASAVDEANSSDSEETFVYESNPPEVNDRPRRFHSRTPSATSMASQVDQRNGGRAVMDAGHSVAMKKSMKFANSYNSDRPEPAAGEDDGTVRSNMGTGRGTTHHHHHHIGRWGRNNGNGHQSLFDNDSPFPNASKAKDTLGAQNKTRHVSSRPTSPRVSNVKLAGNGKTKSPISSNYDLDDGADDERTPLIGGTVRSSRSGRGRRPAASSMRQMEHHASRQGKGFCQRFAGCLALAFMIFMVIASAIGFAYATTQQLTEVKILALKNVLASEQDLILDMQVQARNTNLMSVSIDMADMKVFAKSGYAGTDHEWWKRPHDMMRRGSRGRQSELDPPANGDPNTNPNLDIGHVYELYSPLTFEASPFKGLISKSVGQIRVDQPGNQTTPAGSERWGRVVQHEFDLIVRGTLRYNLPLLSKTHSISVEGRVTVKPNAADQEPDLVGPDPDLHIQPLPV